VVVGKFGGGELGVDGYGAAGDGVEGVFANGLIEGVREIQAADVTAAEPAEIADADAVRDRAGTGILVDDVTDRGGAHEEAVVVVVDAAVVFAPGDDKFGGVAGKEKILEIDIGEEELLVAEGEGVERAVSIFFEKIEVGRVVFDLVGVEVAEEAETGLFVDEEEAAEVSVELLDAGAKS
jgi:hypothetical protein